MKLRSKRKRDQNNETLTKTQMQYTEQMNSESKFAAESEAELNEKQKIGDGTEIRYLDDSTGKIAVRH